MTSPARGEIWLADLDPTKGHEQGGKRPVLVISSSIYNAGPAELLVVLPITTTLRDIPMHALISPPEGGIKSKSAVLCDAIRSISKERLAKRWGAVSKETLQEIEDRLRMLLEL